MAVTVTLRNLCGQCHISYTVRVSGSLQSRGPQYESWHWILL